MSEKFDEKSLSIENIEVLKYIRNNNNYNDVLRHFGVITEDALIDFLNEGPDCWKNCFSVDWHKNTVTLKNDVLAYLDRLQKDENEKNENKRNHKITRILSIFAIFISLMALLWNIIKEFV